MTRHTSITRRGFLGAAPGLSLFAALEARLARAALAADASPYGPLFPAKDETTGLPLLLLPGGFRYLSFGWTGDPLEGGAKTPPAHDGMAAFPAGRGRVRIVRNHEVGPKGKAFADAPVYDAAAGGGTTTLEFDARRGRFLSASASLTGTVRNCAGGPAPWGSWLTCEETLVGPENDFGRPHGYVFEVPATGRASAVALTAMGRFVHEAVAVDPASGIVYETEDAASCGFYRFLPAKRGRLEAGGRLQMLAVKGQPRYDTRRGQTRGHALPAVWVDILEPDRAHVDAAQRDGRGVFDQGHVHGGAVFSRLEGAWHGRGKIYFSATDGGDAGRGQIWQFEPAAQRLSLLFESPGAETLDMPDNLCVSPRGGLVMCEDGPGEQFVRGLDANGAVFPFARNNVVLNGERNGLAGDFMRSEFAGATYSPDGRWLFVNVQNPGITLAVTGPWGKGAL